MRFQTTVGGIGPGGWSWYVKVGWANHEMHARTCHFFMASASASSSQVLPWVPVLIFLNDRLQKVRGNTFSLPKLFLIMVFYNSKEDSNKYRNLYQEWDFGMTVLIIVMEDWERTLKHWAREVIAYWLRRNQYNEDNMVWEGFPWDQCTEALVHMWWRRAIGLCVTRIG